MQDSNGRQGESQANRLLGLISALRFPWLEKTYDVTASLGMVILDASSPDPGVLISQADVATFTSKRSGRNRVSVYTDKEGGAAGDHQEMEIVADLRRAIEENCFELHAQPIASATVPGFATYFEILVRMRNERGQLVPPSLFIPAAERYGLMTMVDRWVIRNALKQYSSSRPCRFDLHFSINLSADSLSDDTLWSFVQEQFALSGVPPENITFEITESGLIQNLKTAKEFIELARRAGCRIALDDFGTGLSSLSYLKQFSFDVLKIDGSFVRELVSSPLDRSIIRAIAEIAKASDAATVAECVEDTQMIQLLQQLGIDYVQGWATGRPVPLDSVLDFVALHENLSSGGRVLAPTAAPPLPVALVC